MSAIDLPGFVEWITQQRDHAYQQAADALARVEQAQQARDYDASLVAGEVRQEALASWSAYALTLSALHTNTGGAYGIPYQDQPWPYRTPKVSAESEQAREVNSRG